MKAELAPKHTQKIGNNYVLWFERSNSYVVISATTYRLLSFFFESQNKETFIQQLQEYFNISENEAKSYFTDFSCFLDDLNPENHTLERKESISKIPSPKFSHQYNFDNSSIVINYGSEKLSQLIHPYLQHALIKDSKSAKTVFDIFDDHGLLYLFKNKSFIGSYNMASFHFLQGKFAMELVTSIYDNSESDWLATFHASTVCNEEEAIMIIGDSGNGKSTLSALLMAHGFDLLADDFTPMLAKNQQLYRFPAAISIKKGAFKTIEDLFEDFKSLKSQKSNSKPITVKYLPPSKPFKSSQKQFECHKLVRVKYSENSLNELCKATSETILQTFIPDSWISPKSEHSKKFLDWLSNLKFYELTYNDNDFAIAKFKELFAL
ncbi:MAG: hypothetical protein R2797_03855 [Gelidibacter sp.]